MKNISQVTKALETVSASKVRRATAAVEATHPYAEKALHVLAHLARQPGHTSLHPLLKDAVNINKILVVLISSDRGLAGAYNMNIVRYALDHFAKSKAQVRYVTVGRKGRDMLLRRRKDVIAEFSNLPANPAFADLSAVGRLVIDEFLAGNADQVFIANTEFVNMIVQRPVIKQLLPLKIDLHKENPTPAQQQAAHRVFTYEPDQNEILDVVLKRFIAVQVYQAILSSMASEHAARMSAMRNATDNAMELIDALQLEYNKARQQTITNDMIDIVGGAEALSH